MAAEKESGGQSEDIKRKTAITDIGLDTGAGLDFNVSRVIPFIRFVYYLGMVNTEKDPSGAGPVSNIGMEFKAGIKFGL